VRSRVALIVAVVVASSVPATAAPAAAPSLCAPRPAGGPSPAVSGGFHAMTPTRVLDTRGRTGPVAAGCGVVIDLGSIVPLHATAAAVNMVAVDATGPGFVTAYSCETARPLASNLNPADAGATANAAIVPLGASRRVCLYASVETELVVDLTGWFGPGGASFHGVAPTRLIDTRKTLRPDGRVGPVAGGTALRIAVAGTGAIPAVPLPSR